MKVTEEIERAWINAYMDAMEKHCSPEMKYSMPLFGPVGKALEAIAPLLAAQPKFRVTDEYGFPIGDWRFESDALKFWIGLVEDIEEDAKKHPQFSTDEAITGFAAIAGNALGGMRASLKRMQATIAAQPVAQAAVPNGYALVPIEPTEAMLESACRLVDSIPEYAADGPSHSAIYQAMLAASPASTKQADGFNLQSSFVERAASEQDDEPPVMGGALADHPSPMPGDAKAENPVVGHKTHWTKERGFYHTPLYADEAAELFRRCEAEDARRAALMPDEETAIKLFFDAWLSLKEFGWKEAIYCPKDGSEFLVIEPGSTGKHPCIYEGEWPTGSWLITSDGDMSPSRPALYKPLAAAPTPEGDAK